MTKEDITLTLKDAAPLDFLDTLDALLKQEEPQEKALYNTLFKKHIVTFPPNSASFHVQGILLRTPTEQYCVILNYTDSYLRTYKGYSTPTQILFSLPQRKLSSFLKTLLSTKQFSLSETKIESEQDQKPYDAKTPLLGTSPCCTIL